MVLHLPHSSGHIPDFSHFVADQATIRHETDLLTDWATEWIFDVPGAVRHIAAFSRVFCDVERLPDSEEPMFAKGAGIYYTLTDVGQPLREADSAYKRKVISEYYEPHHQRLLELVEAELRGRGQALIIDCHSFSSRPLRRELDQNPDRPDICLGTDPFHTPPALAETLRQAFSEAGYSVALNRPYAGTIVPLPLYRRDARVQSIMIEINKQVYMDEETFMVDEERVGVLRGVIDKALVLLGE